MCSSDLSTYKAAVAWLDGWRAVALHPVIGLDAAAKAERQANALVERTRRLLRGRNIPEFRAMNIELLGAESAYGGNSRRRDAREVIARISVEHADKAALDLFMREQLSLLSSMSVGSTTVLPGAITPVVRLFSGLVDKAGIAPQATCDGRTEAAAPAFSGDFQLTKVPRPAAPQAPSDAAAGCEVPLIDLAWVRSGDKGNLFNVAVIARRPEHLPYIAAALTTERVAQWYAHLFDPGVARRVERYFAPGTSTLNFVVHDALGGGGYGSMRIDSVAKGMGQQLLEIPILVSQALAGALEGKSRNLGKGLAYEGVL